MAHSTASSRIGIQQNYTADSNLLRVGRFRLHQTSSFASRSHSIISPARFFITSLLASYLSASSLTPSSKSFSTSRGRSLLLPPKSPLRHQRLIHSTTASISEMVGIISAAGLIGFLSEPEPELQVFALRQLDRQVELFWTEIAPSLSLL